MTAIFRLQQFKIVGIFLLLTIVSWTWWAASARAELAQSLRLSAFDTFHADGTQTFSIRANALPFASFAKSLTSPTGQEFPFVLSPVQSSADLGAFASLQEMMDALAGDWTYRVADPANPSLIESYRFTIARLTSSALTLERPTILRPENGSIVSGPIAFEWSPPSENYGFSAGGVLVDYGLVRPGLLRITPRFDSRFPRVGTISFSTSATQAVTGFVSDPVGPDNPKFDPQVMLTFTRSNSVKVTALPVPEPTPFLLLLTSAVMLNAVPRGRTS
ncbi:MAG: hypothetical protein AB7G28_05345 [Pirellulales bacterium]